MNLHTHNTISMMSAMVGIPHNTDGAKQISKDNQSLNKLNSAAAEAGSVEGGESGEGSGEEVGSEYIKKQSSPQSGKTQRAQTAHVERRQVSEETVADTKQAEQGTEAQAADKTAKTAKSTALKGSMFDTSKQIQFHFNKQMDETQANQDTKNRPDIQRKKFAQNLKKWVDVEYKQYVKDNDPLYSRRNLREILQALGDSDVKTKKTGKKDDASGKNEISFSSFNKYNISQATNTLKIFDEIQLPDNYEAFELVA